MMKKMVLFLLFAMMTISLQAANISWTGFIDTNWAVPGNWTNGKIPTQNDAALVFATNLGTSKTVVVDGNDFLIGNYTSFGWSGAGEVYVSVQDGSLTMPGTGDIYIGNNCAHGILEVNSGGLVDLNGKITVSYLMSDAQSFGAQLDINEGGKVIANVASMAVSSPSHGRLNVDGGSLVLRGNVMNQPFLVAQGGQADITLTKGSIQSNTSVWSGLFSTGIANYTISGGNFSATSFHGSWGGAQTNINMTGGTFYARDYTFLPQAAGGKVDVQLDGGVFNAGLLYGPGFAPFDATGIDVDFDITGGVLVIEDVVDENSYPGMTAYNGARTLRFDYLGGLGFYGTAIYVEDTPTQAVEPVPADVSTAAALNILQADPNLMLSWTPGAFAVYHDVYLGQDYNSVLNADTASAGIYRGRQVPGNNFFLTTELKAGQTYYWRVDEINGETLTAGNVWQFTMADYSLIVDDFESYADETALQKVWGPNSLLDTAVALDTQSLAVEGGSGASRKLNADLSNSWTKALVVLLHGDSANTASAGQIAVTLTDGTNTATVGYPGSGSDIIQNSRDPWIEWNIDLAEFTGVNLNSLKKIGISFAGPLGDIIYVDDIRVYPSRCLTELVPADLSGDCSIDLLDFAVLAEGWLVEYGMSELEALAQVWMDMDIYWP